MSYSHFGVETESHLKQAEAILRAQIGVATQLASQPPFTTTPGQSPNAQVIATLAQALATSYAARVGLPK
ncbi:hypothetical protein KW842_03325 [Duganella sp. sic0402]|uniref:hypothetical protein n=1 Tax=Duganella sp. sic0402 TaxID=2854786 RepID=UPI001C46C2B9|nr:hypothetical protein [Duganella sp. sic0402]MBV7534791.1 hypothetical protein [Duganella sp. sic0402]